MNATQSPLGDRLVETIARRMTQQSARRQKLREDMNLAIADFVRNRDEAHEKLAAKVASLKISEAPSGFKLPWCSQKALSKQLLKSHQKLVGALEQILKEHQKSARETARLLKALAASFDSSAVEHDSV